MKKRCLHHFVLLMLSLVCTSIFSQEELKVKPDQLSIYIECECDLDYVRLEIPYLSYRQEQGVAHIHLQILEQTAGYESTRYHLKFWGQLYFSGQHQEMVFTTNSTMTKDEIRIALVKVIKAGLVPYITQTSAIDQVDVHYDNKNEMVVWSDRFGNWTFGVDGNLEMNGRLLGSGLNDFNLHSELGLMASKLTPEWRILADYDFDYFENFTSTRQNNISKTHRFFSEVVNSIAKHWAIGGAFNFNLRKFSEAGSQLNLNIGPKIEFNIFPYEAFIRNDLRIGLQINYNYQANFTKSNGRIRENEQYGYRGSIIYRIVRKWGDLTIVAFATQDFKNLRDARGGVNLQWRKRLNKRLFLNLTNEMEAFVQQLTASRLDYQTNIGLSYIFGSLHNNVVNPRLGL